MFKCSKNKPKEKRFIKTKLMCKKLNLIENKEYSLEQLKDTNNYYDFSYSTANYDSVRISKNELEDMGFTKAELFEILSQHIRKDKDTIERELINMGGE